MADFPQASILPRPERAIEALGDAFYDCVEPARFPQTILRWRNDRAAAEVGLDTLTDDEWLARFARFEALPGSLPVPLALRYHGHQFRQYNPEIGDGRGFLYAQLRDADGRLMDLGTKGSGRTPWSRFGDGRLTLKGAVRELLATEMLQALGVPTSRTFSIVETGEALERGDEPSPTRGAVLTRLSHGHIRIGTFQRLAWLRDAENMAALTDYCLRHFYGEEGGPDAPARLLGRVVDRTATLAAAYMAAGFVHGVLNTDNINLSGESFDYGPWRFAPTWDPGFTAAYFDHAGLFAFARQPEAIHWNVMQLAVSLRTISDAPPLIEALERFPDAYQAAVARAILWRLGVTPRGADDQPLIEAIERGLREGNVGIDAFLHDSFGGVIPPAYGDAFAKAREHLASYTPRKSREDPHWAGPPVSMLIDEVETLWSAIDQRDDWQPLYDKVTTVRAMGQALV